MAAPHEPAAAALSLAATALRETLAADEQGQTGEARAAFRRAWDALRVATALLQEGWWGAEVRAAEGAPPGPPSHHRAGAGPGAMPPPRVRSGEPRALVTPARLGLPDGYAWAELLVEDVRQAVARPAPPAHPGQSAAGDTAGALLQAVAQRLVARGAHGAPEPASPLAQLLARYALARATALHAALLTAQSARLQPEDRERAAEYYRAYLYLSVHGQSRDTPASVLGRVLARYQWLAIAGVAPGSTQSASMPPGAREPAYKELVFKDSMSSGQVALLLNYFPDAGRREDVRGEWRRLAAALIEVQPELVAMIAREVAAAQAIAIEHRLPLFTWLVELLRGHDPALAGKLEAAALAMAVRPPQAAAPAQTAVPSKRPRSAAPEDEAPRRPVEPPSQGTGAPPVAQIPVTEGPPAAAQTLPGPAPQPGPVQPVEPSAAPPEPAPAQRSVAPPPERGQPAPEERPRLAQPAQPATPARAVPPAPSSSPTASSRPSGAREAEPDSAPPVPPAQQPAAPPEPLDEVNRIWFHYRQGQPLRDVFFRRKRRR